MASEVKPIPDGSRTVTPHLVIDGAARAIDFYKEAFGAVEVCRMAGPGGGVMHAAVRIGDSEVFLCDEFPGMGPKSPLGLGGSPVTIHLFVPDADATFAQAVAAGAEGRMPPMDMFWGDRYAQVTDPFGHTWSIATRLEDLTVEQMTERMASAFASVPLAELTPERMTDCMASTTAAATA